MMKVLFLLALPLLGLCQDLQFRKPPNCLGSEEAMPKQSKCVSTGDNCGGGTTTNGQVSCNAGYMRAGQTGKICIPRCTGDTANCVAGGGSCDAVNFCNCGPGKTFVNNQCQDSSNDKCGGKCFLGKCQDDGSCSCPQDYKLNADKTNCEPIGNCPWYSVTTLPFLCQCIGDSYYVNGVCRNAPVEPPTTTTTETTTTTTVKIPESTTSTTLETSESTTSTSLETSESTTSTVKSPESTSSTTLETSESTTTTSLETSESTTSTVKSPESTTSTTLETSESTTSTTLETPEPTSTTLRIPSTTTILDFSTSTQFSTPFTTPFLNATSTIEPECSCTDIQSVMKQILDELSKLESGI